MKCTEARPLLSSYLDGAVTGSEMHAVSDHLRECAACQSQYRSLEKTRSMVASLGRKQAPPDLAVKISVVISQEPSRSLRVVLQGYLVRLENVFNAFMLPATAGIFSAIVLVGLVLGFVVPPQVSANNDVPSNLFTPPRLATSTYEDQQVSLDSPVVVETYVDSMGQVENYRILSGPDNEEVRQQLNRALLFTVFQPARAFGRRVPGKAVISFSNVNVGE